MQALQDQRDSARLAEHSQRVLAAAGALERLLVDMQTGSRGFIITGEPAFLRPAVTARGEFPARSGELLGLIADNPSQERLATGIAAGIGRYVTDWMEAQIALARRDLAAPRRRRSAGSRPAGARMPSGSCADDDRFTPDSAFRLARRLRGRDADRESASLWPRHRRTGRLDVMMRARRVRVTRASARTWPPCARVIRHRARAEPTGRADSTWARTTA